MFAMRRVVPVSWLNQILLILSIFCIILSLIIQEWIGLIPIPIYLSIFWAVFVTVISVWFSCFMFQAALKAHKPYSIGFLNKWLRTKLESILNGNNIAGKFYDKQRNGRTAKREDISNPEDDSSRRRRKRIEVANLVKEINAKYINVWYQLISEDESFPNEAQVLLKKLLIRVFRKVSSIDKIQLTHKLSNVLLLHFKEYYRAVRRVERGYATSIEGAFKYLHPGSRNVLALEHMLHRIVTILAQEFLQWELTTSLPCKLLLSVLSKRLLVFMKTVSSPSWLFQCLLDSLQPVLDETTASINKEKQDLTNSNNTVSNALGSSVEFATAIAVPRVISKDAKDLSGSSSKDKTVQPHENNKKPIVHLDSIPTEHRGLWGESMSEIDTETVQNKVSPVYEEPTDLATTIARLRTVLKEKSNVSTPLHAEEKSYMVFEGSQFTNLSIPWTEFHTALDGSQQLLYCIQFDDIEQHGEDLFKTITATVKRQYRDFLQLHNSLKEMPELISIMSNLTLPEGGRLELENYLKNLTTRLGNECPSELRHFLRPSRSANKKADIVAPRFDKFLVKTVSGVFNSLKTVVPGFEIEQEDENIPLPTLMPLSDIPWRFVEDIRSKSFTSDLQQLIVERTEYSSVDTAYEAVDSVEGTNDSALLSLWLDTAKSPYDEEVDELDSHLMLTCVAVDFVCELLTGIASNNTLQQEAVVRWTKLLFGNVTEPLLQAATVHVFEYLAKTSLLRNMKNLKSEESHKQLKENLVSKILENIPSDIKVILGEDEALRMLNYVLDSFEIKRINMDLNLQVLDVLTSQLLLSCRFNDASVTH